MLVRSCDAAYFYVPLTHQHFIVPTAFDSVASPEPIERIVAQKTDEAEQLYRQFRIPIVPAPATLSNPHQFDADLSFTLLSDKAAFLWSHVSDNSNPIQR